MLRYNAIVFRQLYSKVIKLKEIFDAIVASCSLYQAATYHFFSIEILINKQTLAFFFLSHSLLLVQHSYCRFRHCGENTKSSL